MLGLIKSYDPETEAGEITIGKETFKFDKNQWIPEVLPEQGDEVAFDLRGVTPYNINLRGALLNKEGAVKSRSIAAIMAFFLGWMGAQRFYLGYYRIAIVQCVVTALLLVAGMMGYTLLWGFIEALLIFSGNLDKDAQGRPLK